MVLERHCTAEDQLGSWHSRERSYIGVLITVYRDSEESSRRERDSGRGRLGIEEEDPPCSEPCLERFSFGEARISHRSQPSYCIKDSVESFWSGVRAMERVNTVECIRLLRRKDGV